MLFRSVFKVRSYLQSILPHLHLLQKGGKLLWGNLLQTEVDHFYFGRCLDALSMPATEPVNSLGLHAPPGYNLPFTEDFASITPQAFRAAIQPHRPPRVLMREVARFTPELALTWLTWLEDKKNLAKTAEFCGRNVWRRAVYDLRLMLKTLHMLLFRPDGWVDIYHEERAAKHKVAKYASMVNEKLRKEEQRQKESKRKLQELRELTKTLEVASAQSTSQILVRGLIAYEPVIEPMPAAYGGQPPPPKRKKKRRVETDAGAMDSEDVLQLEPEPSLVMEFEEAAQPARSVFDRLGPSLKERLG